MVVFVRTSVLFDLCTVHIVIGDVGGMIVVYTNICHSDMNIGC
jgi:hypothetical protein